MRECDKIRGKHYDMVVIDDPYPLTIHIKHKKSWSAQAWAWIRRLFA